jgi:hypothetical protein
VSTPASVALTSQMNLPSDDRRCGGGGDARHDNARLVPSDPISKVPSVDVLDLQHLIADLVANSDLPGMTSVEVTSSATVRTRFGDNAAIFAKIAHLGRGGQGIPGRPSFPPLTVEPYVVKDDLDGGPESVQVSYFATFVEYLLRTCGHPELATVERFEAIDGIRQPYWPPFGVALKFVDDRAAFISFMGTSPDGGNDLTRPAIFIEGVPHGQAHHVPDVRSTGDGEGGSADATAPASG